MSKDHPVWFIAAASSGFGHEIALAALKRGHTVVATARRLERVKDLAEAGAHVLALDVTSPPSTIESVAAKVFEKHGRVDYLVIAAGFILEGAVEEVSRQQVYDSFNTNVFGAVSTIAAFLPRLRAQPVAPDGVRSTIVTFGSLASWRGGAGFSIYAMTKACASSLAESLRDELAPFQIRATTVEPGYFRTSFLNAGVMVNAQKRIEVYNDEATPTGQTRKKLLVVDNNQPGDVVKGCKVIVDVLTGTGLAHGKDLPVRVVLGPDCERVIRDKCSQSLGILDEWKDAIRSTDHDPS
ncbi:NAD(P)-binding domain protein [Metarhizium guizhouense ARSEF 977]|uniref:NAD(P)-binding domain protein n=1 Tax=Metarhizium guizhouense (strain ARSEF 977) TaxID=1276136 RepID=A0A0B4HYM0_METGA|nr:NAD(P)-binding domain protein [Metarhizium guizhouense ARSEF 977]